MPITLAFDVYGTLIDTHGVVTELRETLGADAEAFSRVWRDKQLEYSFRRGLMRDYADFGVCTRQALDWTCAARGVRMTAEQKDGLLASYRALPAFADARPALQRLQGGGFDVYAFSNGKAEAVEDLLVAAGLRELVRGIVSCDEVRSFKPDPAVYRHFLARTAAAETATWMVSGNPFDVIGALSAGMRAAWVRRDPAAVFDPWGTEPTLTVTGLEEFSRAMLEATP
jgi:2-haloacid dehalogenase